MDSLERADRSRELLQNVIFKEAFAAVEADLIRKMKDSGYDDGIAHHELVQYLQTLGNVKRKLEKWVEDGALEVKKVQQDNWRERAKQVWRG